MRWSLAVLAAGGRAASSAFLRSFDRGVEAIKSCSSAFLSISPDTRSLPQFRLLFGIVPGRS